MKQKANMDSKLMQTDAELGTNAQLSVHFNEGL